MIGDDHDIGRLGEAEFGKRRANAAEIVVGVADCGERCRAVNARNERLLTVTLVVLSSIRIARPEDEQEGIPLAGEQWQHRTGRRSHEIILLHEIGCLSPGAVFVLTALRCLGTEFSLRQPLRNFGRKWNASHRSCPIVDDDRLCGAIDMIE